MNETLLLRLYNLLTQAWDWYQIRKCLKQKQTSVQTKNVPSNILDIVGDNVRLGKEVSIYKDTVRIGDYSYMGGGKLFYVKIGKFCSLGYGIYLGSGEHSMSGVSTFPLRARVNGESGLVDFPEQKDTIIENDVWIGNNVMIKQGVRVGSGAIIATGAVVTKDVAPYSIVGGVPAKVIRYRFSEADIKDLLEISWWNWPTSKIQSAIKGGDFNNITQFINKYLPKYNNKKYIEI